MSRKPPVKETLGEFDKALEYLGTFWLKNASRPTPDPLFVKKWSELVAEWSTDQNMPLLIRKSPTGVSRVHKCGRQIVFCDNSPAQWAFLGCLKGELPGKDEIRKQLDNGELPTAMVCRKADDPLFADKQCTPLGGSTKASSYGFTSNIDGKSYRLCHLDQVRLGYVKNVLECPCDLLEAHMRRFLDPANMLTVPINYSGVGECAAFLNVFRASMKGTN